jgi:tetratricopeptide (TPR) repeat protein
MMMTDTVTTTRSASLSSSYIFPVVSASCLEFNNEGIEQLRKGNFDIALGNLVNSLTAAKSMLRLLGTGPTDNDGSGSFMKEGETTSTIKQRPNVSIDTSSILGFEDNMCLFEDHDVTTTQSQEVYRNVFLLSPSWFADLDYKKMLTVSVAIVFNLALTHHLRAIASVKNLTAEEQESRFLQALDLYELAHSMQSNGETMLCMEFSCAVACNLGNIHREVGDVDRSKRCFQHLHTLMIYTQQNMDETEKLSPIATDTFTRCIFTLLLQNNVAPAA